MIKKENFSKGEIMKLLLASMSVVALMLSGCATGNGPEYDGNSYNQIKRYDTGVVVAERGVIIKDDGSGKFLGALIGAVVGSTVGHGDGSVLAALGGGLVGGYAGNEVGKANAKELTIELDNGENIVIVVKGKDIQVGDRIQIIKDGNKVAQVNKI